MNVTSNGSLPGRPLPVAAAALALLLAGLTVALGGCPGPAPHTIPGGSGGDGASSSSATSSSSSTSSSASSSTSSTSSSASSTSSTSSSSGGRPCATASDCSGVVSACESVSCIGGQCTPTPVMKGTTCTENGGHLCDGAGMCVACLVATDCPATPCKLNACAAGACSVTDSHQGSDCKDPDGGAGTCDGQGTCLPARYVFVTTKAFSPSFGNVTGSTLSGPQNADADCQVIAHGATLNGTWMAWLSDSTTSPAKRFAQAQLPVMSQVEYLLLDGTPVADSWAGLVSGSLKNAITLTETKTQLQKALVWTGTAVDGTAATSPISGGLAYQTCGDWGKNPLAMDAVGAAGTAGGADGSWTDMLPRPLCLNPNLVQAHLYCFQQ